MKNPILVKGSPASGKSMRLQEILSSIKNTASVVAYCDANFILENTDNLAHACIAVVEVANANQLERLLEIAQTSDCQLVIIFQTSPVVNLSQDLLAKFEVVDCDMEAKINEAALNYAKEELGEKQFKNNKEAVKAISDYFKAGVAWALNNYPI